MVEAFRKKRGLRFDDPQPSNFRVGYPYVLESITQAHHDAAIAPVSRPLIKEVRAGIDERIRRAEVTRVGHVIELGAELQNLTFDDPRVFHQTEVKVSDAVGALGGLFQIFVWA